MLTCKIRNCRSLPLKSILNLSKHCLIRAWVLIFFVLQVHDNYASIRSRERNRYCKRGFHHFRRHHNSSHFFSIILCPAPVLIGCNVLEKITQNHAPIRMSKMEFSLEMLLLQPLERVYSVNTPDNEADVVMTETFVAQPRTDYFILTRFTGTRGIRSLYSQFLDSVPTSVDPFQQRCLQITNCEGWFSVARI